MTVWPTGAYSYRPCGPHGYKGYDRVAHKVGTAVRESGVRGAG